MSHEAMLRFSDTRFLSDLIEINHEITAILDLDPLLKKIAETTRRFIPYQVFAILLVDDSTDELYYRFSMGHPAEVVTHLRVPIGHGIIGTAARDKVPVVVDDVSKDSRYINVVAGTQSELAVPLISKGRVLGVLDIESPEIGFFREEQVRILDLLASQIAIAIENANLYESERRNHELLSLLRDVSLEIASTLEVEQVINKIAEAVKSSVDYTIFSILLLNESDQVLRPRMVFRHAVGAYEKFDVPLGQGLIGIAVLQNQPIRIGDVSHDDRYINLHSETVSEMVIPLAYKGRVIGALDLESPERNHFTEYDERLLMTLATRIASALVNAELYEKVAENERRLDSELEIARQIQLQLLPEKIPPIGGLELAALFTPAAHLGGDLYDLIRFNDGRFAITVGDVSGKGAPAALYGALASGVIRTRATRKYAPAKMLELVNQSLNQRPIGTQYIALVYAVYEPATKRLSFSNSGLPYPICAHGDGKGVGFLNVSGIPLGLLPDSKYEERVIEIHEGDLIVFYTDGIAERRDPEGEEFGLERLAELVQNNRDNSSDEIVKVIADELKRYSGGTAAHDDQTLLVMKMNAE